MDFPAAQIALQNRKRVALPLWNPDAEADPPHFVKWLEIQGKDRRPDGMPKQPPLQHITLKTPDNTSVYWVDTMIDIVPDILATEWVELPDVTNEVQKAQTGTLEPEDIRP